MARRCAHYANGVYWALRFVETQIFTRSLHALGSDDRYRVLQLELMLRRDQGALIPGSGGLRKLRWAQPGRGKRGGVRVIYFWQSSAETIYLLYAYRKQDKADLTFEKLGRLRGAV